LIVLIIEKPDSTPALRFEKTILLQTHPGAPRSSRAHDWRCSIRPGERTAPEPPVIRPSALRPCSSPVFRPDVFPLHDVRYGGRRPEDGEQNSPIGPARALPERSALTKDSFENLPGDAKRN
jgi:hypothetical protein